MRATLSTIARRNEPRFDQKPVSIAELMPHLLLDPAAVMGEFNPPHADGLRIDFINDAYIRPNDNAARPLINVLNSHMRDFADREDIDLLAPRDTFFHWLKDPIDVEPIGRGETRRSRNAKTGPLEPGFSVVEDPWDYFRMRTHCIFVSGAINGRGHDDEPTLRPESVKVVGPVWSREDILKKFQFRNEHKLTELAEARYLSPAELFCFVLGA